MELDADSIAVGRQRLLEVYGSARGLMGWMLLMVAMNSQPADITFYKRKPSLEVTVDPRLAHAVLSGSGPDALRKAMQRIKLSNGTETAFSEIWTVNPMPVGGLSEADLAATDMSHGNVVIAANGATMRQVIQETYHCTTDAEVEFHLRRFIAS
jgi:hypothetical protein